MASKRTKGVRTQWFAMTDTPARKGLYECDSCPALHVWDGENWTIDGEPCRPDSWFIAATKWRGLVRPNGEVRGAQEECLFLEKQTDEPLWKDGEGRDVYLRRLVPLADGFWSEDGLGAVMSDMAVI